MEFSEPTIIKLKSGLDIIANVREVTKTRVVLENPFTLETLLLLDQNGVPRDEKILMKKWCNWTKDSVISLPKQDIMDVMTPNDKAVAHYMVVLKNGGIFRMTASEQAELEAGAAFMEEIFDKIKRGEPLVDPTQSPPDESLAMDADADEDDFDLDEFGNRPNDWSPDPRDYI